MKFPHFKNLFFFLRRKPRIINGNISKFSYAKHPFNYNNLKSEAFFPFCVKFLIYISKVFKL